METKEFKKQDFQSRKSFKDINKYMNFCYENKLTRENSLAIYNDENGKMTLYFNY